MQTNQEEVPHLLKRLNSAAYAERSEALLQGIGRDERRSWYEHPVTEAFKLSLEADIAGILALWLEGAYAEAASSDETAQRQAKARGIAQALNDVLEWIEDLREVEND